MTRSRDKAWWPAELSSFGITLDAKRRKRFRLLAYLQRDPTRIIEKRIPDQECVKLIEALTKYVEEVLLGEQGDQFDG